MAAATVKPAMVLDTQGLLCPAPVIKASQAVKQIQVGQVLELLATDPGSKPDITAWSKMTGHELLDMDEMRGSPTVYRFHIRRMK